MFYISVKDIPSRTRVISTVPDHSCVTDSDVTVPCCDAFKINKNSLCPRISLCLPTPKYVSLPGRMETVINREIIFPAYLEPSDRLTAYLKLWGHVYNSEQGIILLCLSEGQLSRLAFLVTHRPYLRLQQQVNINCCRGSSGSLLKIDCASNFPRDSATGNRYMFP